MKGDRESSVALAKETLVDISNGSVHRAKLSESFSHKNQPRATRDEIRHFCAYLAPIMNDLHNVSHSARFWTILVGDHVKASLNRRDQLSRDVDIYSIPIRAIDYPRIPSKSMCRKISIVERLRAILIRGDGPGDLSRKGAASNIFIGRRFSRIARGRTGFLWTPSMPPLWFPNTSARRKLDSLARLQAGAFIRNVLYQMPRYYVEWFGHLYSRVPELPNPKSKILHIEHHENTFAAMAVAKFVDEGASLYSYQKGGDFGEIEALVRSTPYDVIDRFYTYGWKINDKDVPFFGVRLEEFKERYKKHRLKDRRSDVTIFYNLVTSVNQKMRYSRLTEELFKGLDRRKYPRIVLRPRGVSRIWSSRSSLDFVAPSKGVSIDSGRTQVAKLCGRSGLIIHLDNPSTNFLECVFVDHPVMSLLTNQDPTNLVEPYYDFFIEVGIMHHGVEPLVSHLNRIDVAKWWQEVIQDSRYVEFKQLFARSRDDYLSAKNAA